MYAAVRTALTCDHRRSVEYLSKYLKNKSNKRCFPLAYKCHSWNAYENGLCHSCGSHGESCAIVGEERVVDKKAKNLLPFYIKTCDKSPSCGKLTFTTIGIHKNRFL